MSFLLLPKYQITQEFLHKGLLLGEVYPDNWKDLYPVDAFRDNILILLRKIQLTIVQ